MLIEGPMKIAIAVPADGQGKILVVTFDQAFQAADLGAQTSQFRDYLTNLAKQIDTIEDPADRNRAGMLIVQQIVEQLLPHIEAGELALEERMTIQIRQDGQAGALSDLLATERR